MPHHLDMEGMKGLVLFMETPKEKTYPNYSPEEIIQDIEDCRYNLAIELKYTKLLTPAQVVEAFPEEAKEYVLKYLRSLRAELEPFFAWCRSMRVNRKYSAENRDYQVSAYKELIMPKSKVRRFADLKAMARIINQGVRGVTDESIQIAKKVSIWSLYDFKRHTGKTACCPFHEDRTPSFSVNRYNRWICYSGCGKGDAIDFIMKLNHVPFHQAIDILVRL